VLLFAIRRYHGTTLAEAPHRYELVARWAAGLFAA
jgi:hypothetical protein